MTAQVELPATAGSRGVYVGNQPARAHRAASWWVLDDPISGNVTVEVR